MSLLYDLGGLCFRFKRKKMIGFFFYFWFVFVAESQMDSFHSLRISEFTLLKGLVLSLLCLHLLEGRGSHQHPWFQLPSTYGWHAHLILRLRSFLKPPSAIVTYHKGNTPPPLSIPHRHLNQWHRCPCQQRGSHLWSAYHPTSSNPQQRYMQLSIISSLSDSDSLLFYSELWNELTPTFICWSPHPQYLRMGHCIWS